MGRVYPWLTCIALAGFAGPAAACINDEESPTHEREFRSQYQEPAILAHKPAADSGGSPSNGLLIGVGAASLSGAVVLTLTRGRARA